MIHTPPLFAITSPTDTYTAIRVRLAACEASPNSNSGQCYTCPVQATDSAHTQAAKTPRTEKVLRNLQLSPAQHRCHAVGARTAQLSSKSGQGTATACSVVQISAVKQHSYRESSAVSPKISTLSRAVSTLRARREVFIMSGLYRNSQAGPSAL
jgi:hypothetical protein